MQRVLWLLVSFRRCWDYRAANLLPCLPNDTWLSLERSVFGVKDFLVFALVLGDYWYFVIDFRGEHWRVQECIRLIVLGLLPTLPEFTLQMREMLRVRSSLCNLTKTGLLLPRLQRLKNTFLRLNSCELGLVVFYLLLIDDHHSARNSLGLAICRIGVLLWVSAVCFHFLFVGWA